MKILKAIAWLSPLIIFLITTYISHNEIDVRYFLSNNIPVSNSTESVQQLEVKNFGAKPAQKIVVKINGQISSFEVLKYSHADIIKENKENGLLEVIYPELPPTGSFRVILKSMGNGITKSQVEVIHNNGKAIDALSKNNSSILYYFILLLYALFVLYIMRDYAISKIERNARYDNSKEVLASNKPFYISKDRWRDIRKLALDNLIIENYYVSLDKSSYYVVLANKKLEFLTENEWHYLKNYCIKKLTEQYKNQISDSFLCDGILNIIKINIPENFPVGDWENLQKQAVQKFIDCRKYRLLNDDESGLVNEITLEKPEKIMVSVWNNHVEFIKKQYVALVLKNMEFKREPFKYLSNLNLEIVSHDQREKIYDRAYRIEMHKLIDILEPANAEKFLKDPKPNWIKQNDYERFIGVATNVIQVSNQLKEYKLKVRLINRLIEEVSLPDVKPNEIGNEEWQELKLLEEKMVFQLQENNELKDKLRDEKQILENNITRVQKQLEIIHEFLSDSSVLDRIEDYNNVFAKGNFENLRRIANYLSRA